MSGTEMTYELYAGLSDYVPNHVLSGVLQECMEEIGAPEFDEADFALAKAFLNETSTKEELEAKKVFIKKRFGAENLEAVMERPLDTSIAPLEWKGEIMAGSTDVGDASYVVPTAQFNMATAALGTAGHTWQMTAHGNTEIAWPSPESGYMRIPVWWKRPELNGRKRQAAFTSARFQRRSAPAWRMNDVRKWIFLVCHFLNTA